MRVLIISGSGLPIRCGISNYTDHLLRQLQRQAVDVRVVTHAEATGSDSVHNVVQNWTPGCLRQLVAEIEDFEPDVLHFMYPSVKFSRGPFVNLLPHLLKQRSRKVPLVITLHEYHNASVLGRLRCLLTAAAADLLVVSNSNDQRALRRFRLRRLVTVPLGNDIPVVPVDATRAAALRRKYAIHHEQLIGFVGFVDDAKGVDRAIRAASLLPNQPALLFLSDFLADNPLHCTLREQAEELGVALYWPGYLPREEVSLLIQECQMMVFPFRQAVSERRSTFITALVHGRPSIATGASIGPFVDEQNCLLLPEMTPQALATSIDRLQHDPQLRQHLSGEARKLADLFDWDRVGSTYRTLYEDLVSPH
jgi:glycosyltransferase involved in cell wall biosynthesis